MPNWTYHTIDENDVSNLRALIGEEQRMLWKEQISEDYSHDELGGTSSWPELVIKPVSANEVSAVMKYAY